MENLGNACGLFYVSPPFYTPDFLADEMLIPYLV